MEVRVGLLVLVAALLLGTFVFVLGGIDLSEGYPIYVDFQNPGNIKPGAPVNVGNIRIGRVREIEYRGGRLDPETGRRPLIRLTLEIDQDVEDTLHEDALFYVSSQSLLGEQNISVDPGEPERPLLPPGSIVQGVDPPRMDLALALAYELLESVAKLVRENRDELEGLLQSTARMIRSLDRILSDHSERIDRIIENVETASAEASLLMQSARGTLEAPELRRSLRNLDRSLASVARDIDPILADVRSATGRVNETLETIGPEEREGIQQAIREAGALAENANAAVADARRIVSHIREGRGSIGALVMDEEIYDDLQEMLRDIKHNPWKLFWRE